MAQTSQKIRFVYGTKAKYNSSPSSYANDVYFVTDTYQIIARGVIYGVSDSDKNYLDQLVKNGITTVKYSNGVLSWSGISGANSGSATLLGSTTPKALGTANPGTSTQAARADHVHPAQTTVTGNAGSATKLQTSRTIDGVTFDGTENIVHFAMCSTAAATAAKTVTLDGFSIAPTPSANGARISVQFTNGNTATSPTLSVNGGTAFGIAWSGGGELNKIAAGQILDLVFYGSGNNFGYHVVGTNGKTYDAATQSAAGLMSAADKAKLDGIAAGATKVSVDTTISSISPNPVQNKVVKAELDKKVPIGSDGKIAISYLPSFVDDVIDIVPSKSGQSSNDDYSGLTAGVTYVDKDTNPWTLFTSDGSHQKTKVNWEDGKIYIDTSNSKTYRWSGTTVVPIASDLALGETSSTAFPGDRGKTLETKMSTAETNITNLTTRVSNVEAQLCWYEA